MYAFLIVARFHPQIERATLNIYAMSSYDYVCTPAPVLNRSYVVTRDPKSAFVLRSPQRYSPNLSTITYLDLMKPQ